MKRFLYGTFGLLVLGCSDETPNCSSELQGNWALSLSLDAGEDGSCPYEGTYEIDGGTEDLVCEKSDGSCLCTGGNAYGRYTVTIKNLEDGTTNQAVLDVTGGGWPACVSLDPVTSFAPVKGAGGAGGAGGSQ